jgi:uncharacterized membrane protein
VKWLPIVEIVAGIIALLYAGAAFINLTWSEGASSQKMQKESARKTRRLFAIAGVFALICVVCAYLSMR